MLVTIAFLTCSNKSTSMNKYTLLVVGAVFCTGIFALNLDLTKGKKKPKPFRVMFYNVENLFDVEDDEGVDDADFLPSAEAKWTQERLDVKLGHIAQVIRAVGGEDLPDVVGFSEVENRKVLDFLLQNTDLKKEGYSIVHYDSPDKRGIDVGLIYRKDRFTFVKSGKYPVIFSVDNDKPTRDLLYVKGMLPNKSSLHLVVNHWPSRSGGASETEPKRMDAAKAAKRLCDSIQTNEKNANILLMGDFNDYPTNKSMREVMQAEIDSTNKSGSIYNMMGWQKGEGVGSHQYKGDWGFLDQFLASEALIKGSSGMQTWFNQAKVLKADFLLVKNEKYGTMEPSRTYGGKNYLGGYSDHLPVFVDIWMK